MSILYKILPSVLHTRLRDIVFGRQRITVIDRTNHREAKSRPVFIIGCFRSGTTLLRYLIDSHSEICCPPETKILTPLSMFYQDKSIMKALDSLGFSEDYIRVQLRDFADNFYQDHMVANKKKLWVDKTPEYVRIISFLEWLYGNEANYIFVFRNGLDVTQSMFEQFIEPLEPNKTLDKAFAYWFKDARIMLEWLPQLQGRCYQVLYENLCREPDKHMRGIFEFLNVPYENVVDDWYRKRHHIGYEDIKARRRTSIEMSHGNFREWDKDKINAFMKLAADVHEQIGYNPATLLPKDMTN